MGGMDGGGMGGMDGGGMGGMGGEMGGMGGMGGGSMMAPQGPEVDYLLIRFFDFKAIPGKKYRYRVRVFMEDVNRPENAAMAPSGQTLGEEVAERIAAVIKEEEEMEDLDRKYWLLTDWSEPREVITVELPNRTLAGQLADVRREKISDFVTVHSSEPSAKVMSIVWDPVRAVDVQRKKQTKKKARLKIN